MTRADATIPLPAPRPRLLPLPKPAPRAEAAPEPRRDVPLAYRPGRKCVLCSRGDMARGVVFEDSEGRLVHARCAAAAGW
jgi:hypothetical protein